MNGIRLGRRDFLRLSALAGGALGLGAGGGASAAEENELDAAHPLAAPSGSAPAFNGSYAGSRLNQIAFPLGGMGAGMVCLEGTGALAKFSLHHRPELASAPGVFAAVSIQGPQKTVRILEGLVPDWKLRPQFPANEGWPPGGFFGGLPRFHRAIFAARFPFATVQLKDDAVPLDVELTGWSPFSPGDADNASLPVAALEYKFTNRSGDPIEGGFSFCAANFMAEAQDPAKPAQPSGRIRSMAGGFVLSGPGARDRPWDAGHFAAWVDDPDVKVNLARDRDDYALQIKRVFKSGEFSAQDPEPGASSSGASLHVPFTVGPGQTRTITLRFAWYVPKSNLFEPAEFFQAGKWIPYPPEGETYRPWYAGRFAGIEEVIGYWQSRYQTLRQAAATFTRTFYDSTVPPEAIEAVAANLTILKSPTVLRQVDGRLWGWEGCNDSAGSCPGSSNHVWNYAQAVAHLFPELERSLRETEFGPNQNDEGHQFSRAALPIRPLTERSAFSPSIPDAADGQLGGIIKAFRDWRISGDTAWLRRLWPRIHASLDYCIRTWDPEHRGWIEEPHLTTYDLEFWGPDSMCTSLYLGALKAATLMGQALGETVDRYSELLGKGIRRMEEELFNGEYFQQKVVWRNLRTPFPKHDDDPSAQYLPGSPENGPNWQYGPGCLSDGVLGVWLGLVSGVGDVLDAKKVESHLAAVHRYNLKANLAGHIDLMRYVFACGDEAGLLVCTWPRGGEPARPMIYADEVWTGIEYQVASHLIAVGKVSEGLEIVRACRRRYDGRIRNPFGEVEAGHWYARAMSSYALLQALSGARFDAVDKILDLKPAIKGDFRCFLSTATGFGTVGVKNGQPFLEVASGAIPCAKIKYTAA